MGICKAVNWFKSRKAVNSVHVWCAWPMPPLKLCAQTTNENLSSNAPQVLLAHTRPALQKSGLLSPGATDDKVLLVATCYQRKEGKPKVLSCMHSSHLAANLCPTVSTGVELKALCRAEVRICSTPQASRITRDSQVVRWRLWVTATLLSRMLCQRKWSFAGNCRP